jgi:hypothetical protein
VTGGIFDFLGLGDLPEPHEVTFAEGRLTMRTYATRSFKAAFGRDVGHPTRYIYRVFDETQPEQDANLEWVTDVVYTTPGARKQLQLQVARDAGAVRKLRIQKVPLAGDLTKLETILELDRDQAGRLIDMLRAIDMIPIEGESSVHVDDQLLRDVFHGPGAIARIHAQDPERFRTLIESDARADDVIALQRRREVATRMRSWLEDESAFDAASEEAGGPERAWQRLLEANPWVLGVGLTSQLLTSWAPGRLEQTLVGRHIRAVGKRADALLQTAGIVRSLVTAEIKHHRTALLADECRAGCWSPSKELSGAVVQSQQTAHLAAQELGDYVEDQSAEGELLGSGTFLLRPRSIVVVGSLAQLVGPSGGALRDRVRSFELFRRNLQEPEIMTFDELVARAEWHVDLAAGLTGADAE